MFPIQKMKLEKGENKKSFPLFLFPVSKVVEFVE